MQRFRHRNVVITGGSSGIGLAIAEQFAALGAKLVLIARRGEQLERAAQIVRSKNRAQVATFCADVGNREQIQRVIHKIGEEYGGIHTLIANAGFSYGGRFEDNAIERLEREMQVNYFGMVYAIKAAWPYIKAAEAGHLGLVSSVGGYLGAYGYSSYSPTKFAVTGLAECLRMEAADYGIGVTVLFPPDTDTPMLQRERENTLPECLALSSHSGLMQPEQVAQQFVAAVINYRFEVICNLESRLLRIYKALFPRRYYKFLDHIVARDRRRRGDIRGGISCR